MMAKRTFRYDSERDELVNPDGSRTDFFFDPRNFFEPCAPMLISDIDEYRSAAGDVAHEGKRVRIGSRSRHREFLKDNKLVEVGNDFMTPQLANNGIRKQTKADFLKQQKARVESIKRSVDLVRTGRVKEHYDVGER